MRDMVQVRRSGGQRYSGPDIKIGRSQFNRSHGLKTTFNASYLVPILVDEVLPGDTFTMSLNGFCRIFSPLAAPVMDNITLETFFFFVPNRLIWDNWEAFNGAHDAAGAQDTTFTIPILASGLTVNHDISAGTGSSILAAYMGLPDDATSAANGISALPFRAYTMIFNEWFRDQNLTAETTLETGNGPQSLAYLILHKTNKKHDYFTSCLPYLQKGTAISVALQGVTDLRVDSEAGSHVAIMAGGTPATKELDSGSANLMVDSVAGTALENMYIDLSTVGATDTTAVPSIDVNALRQSVAIQRLLERDARGGTRYTEILKTQFGVTSPDFRLQRPEYLGGGKSMINITPVAATTGIKAASSPDALDSNVGELRGVGTGVIQGHGWAKSFTEHGHIIGIVRARGDITYWQGMDKMWTRSTRYDFYIPALANLGEQSVLQREIFVDNTANDDGVFGYQERWAEYRTKLSRLSGNFNPNVSGAISHWHLAEDLSAPALNTVFVNDQTPMSRITTVDTEEDFLLDVWFNYKCARPIPVRSVPSLISRF